MSDALGRLRDRQLPLNAPVPLRALWHELNGGWHAAHALVEETHDAAGCLMHAFLHRVEGDLANAAYWYRRAGAPVCWDDLDTERAALAERFSR